MEINNIRGNQPWAKGSVEQKAETKKSGVAGGGVELKIGNRRPPWRRADGNRLHGQSRIAIGISGGRANSLLAKLLAEAKPDAEVFADPEEMRLAPAELAGVEIGTEPQVIPLDAGAVLANRTLEAVTEYLADNPNADKADLLRAFPERIKAAGGGQGNVIFIKDSDIVVKKRLAGPERTTYEFLKEVNDMFSVENAAAEPPAYLAERFTPDEIARMRAQKDDIAAIFPLPRELKALGGENPDNNVMVVIPNAAWRDGRKIADSVEDIKLGKKIVSRGELQAHRQRGGRGRIEWLFKKVATRYIPFIKKNHVRGYEFVSQSPNKLTRLVDARNSRENIEGKLAGLNAKQREHLLGRLEAAQRAHAAMPVTFVGSSAMIALPEPPAPDADPQGEAPMPNVSLGDFAHAIFTYERDSIPPSTYRKYRENFDSGIRALADLVRGGPDESKYIPLNLPDPAAR